MTNKYQENWFANAAGRAVDPTGDNSLDCVDAAKDYFEAIFGVTWWKGWPGAGNALDMLWTCDLEYFDRILNDPNDPNLIPQRGDIVVWGGSPMNPYGHIAVVLAADVNGVTVMQEDTGLQVPMFVGTLPYYIATAGTVSGWLRPKFDDSAAVVPQGNITPAAPSRLPNQRVSGPYVVNQRAEPKSSADVVRSIPPSSMETWDGFVHGDLVTIGDQSSDIWFKDGQGYVSAILFDPADTSGLADLTPTADLAGENQRITGDHGAIRRGSPDKNATALETFVADRILTFKGFVHGTDPYGDGNDLWFVGITGGYFWSGVFTNASVGSLPDLTTKDPAPAPVASYDFALDFAEINGIKVEKRPTDIGNVDVGNFVALDQLRDFVAHWWGSPSAGYGFDGVVSELIGKGHLKSVQWVVTDTRIAQLVKLGDRAYHATASNGNMFGIEIDPRAYTPGPVADKIWANVRALVTAVEGRIKGKLTGHLHKDTPGNVGKTDCSGLDLRNLAGPVPAPVPAPQPPVVVPVDPQPVPAPPAPPAPPVVPEVPPVAPGMSSLALGLVRTVVPAIVGQVASWMLLIGIALDPAAQGGLSTFLGVVLTGLYYAAIRLLERWKPGIGVLLGAAAQPVYHK